MFRGGGLYIHQIHIQLHSFRQPLTHQINVRPQFGFLGHNGHVHIDRRIALLAEAAHNHLEQLNGIRAFVLHIRIREQLADVPQRSRAQQRVHQGMGGHVRVAVTQQAQRMGHFHATQDQLAAFHQLVHIHAVSNSQHPFTASRSSRSRRMASAKAKSTGVVSFRFSRLPSVRYTDLPQYSTSAASSVAR